VHIAVLAVVATLSPSEPLLRSSPGYRSLTVLLTTPKYLSHFSRVFHSRFARHNWKLEDGHLVEGGNVGIHGGGGGDKGADFLWIPGLTTVEVDRSVKVRRDSRKRSQPILANIGHFLLPLERVRCNSEYTVFGKTDLFGSSPPHSATRSAATAFIM
jgi:hypothetical protein